MAEELGRDARTFLGELADFIDAEQEAGFERLREIWNRPLQEKLEKGWTQAFSELQPGESSNTLWAVLSPEANESRFREGDLLRLHGGDPRESLLGRLSLDLEDGDRWLLRGNMGKDVRPLLDSGVCYADPDAMDLTEYYRKSLEEIASSRTGKEVVIPLLMGTLPLTVDPRAQQDAECAAARKGLNRRQAEAVGLAVGAEQVACIQGPPGTGKTRVLALVAKLLVERGERILVTSHTHTAINNALNKIHEEGVTAVKIGNATQIKGLDPEIGCYPEIEGWLERPKGAQGYVVGATPFATCTSRLETVFFDTILFDEASQITKPLALMAMRKGQRFVFIGDQKQLPPVVLAKSILDESSPSVFASLTSSRAEHCVMLEETYRMNRSLTEWPSRNFYEGKLMASGSNRDRVLTLSEGAGEPRFAPIFDPEASMIFVPTTDMAAKTRNRIDARLTVDLCEAAVAGGLPLSQIGIVSPYRAQGRLIRNLIEARFGKKAAREVVADTVERMQGQEREMIILSLATGDNVFLGLIADFFFQPERLNVSVTRSKVKLVVIGPDVRWLSSCDEEPTRERIERYRDLIGHCKRVVI